MEPHATNQIDRILSNDRVTPPIERRQHIPTGDSLEHHFSVVCKPRLEAVFALSNVVMSILVVYPPSCFNADRFNP